MAEIRFGSGRTWLDTEEATYPDGGMRRKGRAIYPDGVIRWVRAGVNDSFNSAPAMGKMDGKHIRGYVTLENGELHFHPVA